MLPIIHLLFIIVVKEDIITYKTDAFSPYNTCQVIEAEAGYYLKNVHSVMVFKCLEFDEHWLFDVDGKCDVLHPETVEC